METANLNSKNYTISLVRVSSMLMIIGCHLCSWLNLNALSMILNVGVYVFLLISGLLYSNKKIENSLSFIEKRWVKLCVPMYFMVLFLIIYFFIGKNYDVAKSIPVYLFDLQGLGFFVSGISLHQLNGLEHLWFLSVIMVCYFLMLVVKKFEKTSFWNNRTCVTLTFSALIVIDILLTYTIGFYLHYFITFFLGYYFGKLTDKITAKKYIVSTICMIFAMAARLLVRNYFDGTIFYNIIIAQFSHIVLAVWIYYTFLYFSQKFPELSEKIAKSYPLRVLEKHSMYLYMTHYMFLVGPFHIDNVPTSKAVQILIFIAGCLISSKVLQVISDFTINKINKLIK